MTEQRVLGGTDGFRGKAELEVAGPGRINAETFEYLTASLVSLEHDKNREGPVVVACDTRPSGLLLKQAAIRGAFSMGAEVIDLDVAPTPTAQKIAQKVGALATVVVTASHNTVGDNGWKGMIADRKPHGNEVDTISERYWQLVDSNHSVRSLRPHVDLRRRDELTRDYANAVITDIRETFDVEKPLDGKKFVVDGAYGAAKVLTPAILRELGAEVREYACDDEGIINDGCGAANLTGLTSYLRARENEYYDDKDFVGAIANDGDADRMLALGVLHRQGHSKLEEINGNHIMWALAQDQPGIIGTEYTNLGLVTRLNQRGIGFEYCENGDVNVTKALLDKQQQGMDWTRGGEFTGHHVDTKWLSSGDGVRMAAWFAVWATQNDMTFGEIYQQLPLVPDKKIEIPLEGISGKALNNDKLLQEYISEFKELHKGEVRFITRASGTENVYRVWGEGVDKHDTERAVQSFANMISDRVEELKNQN